MSITCYHVLNVVRMSFPQKNGLDEFSLKKVFRMIKHVNINK